MQRVALRAGLCAALAVLPAACGGGRAHAVATASASPEVSTAAAPPQTDPASPAPPAPPTPPAPPADATRPSTGCGDPRPASAKDPVVLLKEEDRAQVVDFAGVTEQPGKGLLAIGLEDCDGHMIDGGTVSISPASGTLVYANNLAMPDVGHTGTMSNGLAYVFNVDPGWISVAGETAEGVPLRARTVEVIAGRIVSVVITP